ncbi:MAG: right-handed parallel beta-helix repeat-containing protein [Fidelibacterota bacterium]
MNKLNYLILTVVFLINNVSGNIINVPADAATIQAGIDSAITGDTVLVHSGTYTENISIVDRDIVAGSLYLTTGDTSYISQTIIDGDSSGSVVYFLKSESILTGFTVRNGLANYGGGGVKIDSSSNFTVSNCIIENNYAVEEGGGIWFSGENNSIRITDSKIRNNKTSNRGGGIFLDKETTADIKNSIIMNNSSIDSGGAGGLCIWDSDSATITNVIFDGNSAETLGGCIFASNAEIDIKNTIVRNNSSARHGGGFVIFHSNIIIDSCVFEGNSAENGDGGAINYYNWNTAAVNPFDLNIKNTQFIDNSAEFGSGGGVLLKDYESSGLNVSINNCDFIDNTSRGYCGLSIAGGMVSFEVTQCQFINNESSLYAAGGGFSRYTSGVVSSCLFALNKAALGDDVWYNSGGISVWSYADVDFVNCTFADNVADYGAGITVGGGGIASAKNCVFWGNNAEQLALATWDSAGGTLSVDYCDVEGGMDSVNVIDSFSSLTWGTNNLDAEPLFCNPDSLDYSLANNSPCIGTGENGVNMGAFDVGCEAKLSLDNELYPTSFALHQNYPNPFNPVTNILFGLPEPRNIRLTVVNILGQEVVELTDGWHDLGFHTVQWNGLNQFGQNVSAGMYFAVLSDGKSVRVQKMLLLK